MPPIDAGEQGLPRIALPGEHHPACAGVGGQEGPLHGARGLRHRNVAGLAAFLEDLHVINAAVAEELALMPIESGRQPREHRIARVEPTRPREAGPLSLGYDVCVGKAPL